MLRTSKQKNTRLTADYFRPRDFEYVQPLYDLAFLLQIDAQAKQTDVPEYRTFALWKAALALDGYTTNVDCWLENWRTAELLDCDPSRRIREHLLQIKETGTLPELTELSSPAHKGCLRLRSLRGLGTKQIAEALALGGPSETWLNSVSSVSGIKAAAISQIWEDNRNTSWQSAHVVPPLIRFLHSLEQELDTRCKWVVPGLGDGLSPIIGEVEIYARIPFGLDFQNAVQTVLDNDRFFDLIHASSVRTVIGHRLGWQACIKWIELEVRGGRSSSALARQADLLISPAEGRALRGDLHAHTNWSDGASPLTELAEAANRVGLQYLAITDHSRSSKLQEGLTPVTWLRQAASLSLLKPTIKVLHGLEVDILSDGTLDMPHGLLGGMDIVVGSVHSSWSDDYASNTDRILQAIGSGQIDILGHPTAMILGKPGVPAYKRPPISLNWDRVFEACKRWQVALEFNCFPSRLDLTVPLLKKASEAGCWISFGSDAHSRAHLRHINIAHRVITLIDPGRVLNLLSYDELKTWLKEARALRLQIPPEKRYRTQPELFQEQLPSKSVVRLHARVAPHVNIPPGSKVVGLDLTASKAKPTGVAVLEGLETKTCSLESDEEILSFIVQRKPAIVSIDSPLGLPGGGHEISPAAGIVRVAEHDLASVGIPAYPALIDSMKPLTLRGMKLRREIEALPKAPQVIESYPGAAQDILCIPRKQKGLGLLRAGLRELGLCGPGLDTRSHDEMDAITAAIVGRFYEVGDCEPMGISSEAQLIVPKLTPLKFNNLPVICLAGQTGAGKSVIARYLALFFGFYWLKTRNIIQELLVEDIHAPPERKMFHKNLDEHNIKVHDLTEFGLVVLEKYQQQPFIAKLSQTVASQNRPIVVDSVRDLADYECLLDLRREVMLWFVDTPDALVQSRLSLRGKNTSRPIDLVKRIDQKIKLIKTESHVVMPNSGSLEALRWVVDDTLFGLIALH